MEVNMNEFISQEYTSEKYISLDIGGTIIKHGIISSSGQIEVNGETPTEAKKGADHVLQKVQELIREYQKNYEFTGICISTAGIVDDSTGIILYANENLPGYTGKNVKKYLEDIFQIPVEVENDALCAGLSETFCGAAKDSKVTLCITIGTGIGGCIILDNKLFRGFGNSAGEIGYMKMFDSDFQSMASTSALVAMVSRGKGISNSELNGVEVFRMARAGDRICREAIADFCDKIGYGIANICYVINPEVVVLGGGIVKQKDYIYDLIRNSMDKYLIDLISKSTILEFARNGNQAGMLGAFYNFTNKHRR